MFEGFIKFRLVDSKCQFTSVFATLVNWHVSLGSLRCSLYNFPLNYFCKLTCKNKWCFYKSALRNFWWNTTRCVTRNLSATASSFMIGCIIFGMSWCLGLPRHDEGHGINPLSFYWVEWNGCYCEDQHRPCLRLKTFLSPNSISYVLILHKRA